MTIKHQSFKITITLLIASTFAILSAALIAISYNSALKEIEKAYLDEHHNSSAKIEDQIAYFF